MFSVAMSIWMYVRFYKYRHMPFTRPWWTWLVATGISLSFVMSTKYVGLFTFITIGSAVAVDLWNLLDYRRGLPMVPQQPPPPKQDCISPFRFRCVAFDFVLLFLGCGRLNNFPRKPSSNTLSPAPYPLSSSPSSSTSSGSGSTSKSSTVPVQETNSCPPPFKQP